MSEADWLLKFAGIVVLRGAEFGAEAGARRRVPTGAMRALLDYRGDLTAKKVFDSRGKSVRLGFILSSRP